MASFSNDSAIKYERFTELRMDKIDIYIYIYVYMMYGTTENEMFRDQSVFRALHTSTLN